MYDKLKSDNFNKISEYIPQDFTLKVFDNEEVKRKYYVHMMILDSAYFIAFIDGGFKKSKELKIYVKNFLTIEYFLEYLYTYKLNEDIEEEILMDLKTVADIYLFDDLYRSCEIYYYKYLFF